MKNIKHSLFLSLLLSLLFILSACGVNDEKDDRPKIVTTIFPLYDFTKQIAQDKVNVELILPAGVEPHSFDPKPRGIFEIRNADIFIYTGDFLEIWASKIINVLDEDKVIIINSSNGVNLLTGEEEEHDEEKHHHESYDPHIWVDPFNAMIMIDNILTGLIQLDPDNESFYKENAINYKNKLKDLDLAYQELFNNSKYDTIIFGGHFIFGYLAHRYELNYQTPYSGFSSDTLPTPKKLQELINIIEKTGEQTIYYEELVNPKVASLISEETGAKMLPLNGAGNVSKDDFERGITYLDIMYKNIENLKKGLLFNGQSINN